MAFSPQQYEDAYAEALRCLSEVMSVEELPRLNGKRFSAIDGKALDDHAVLTLFWGPTITREIEESQ